MDHRILVGTLLFFGASLAAQTPAVPTPAVPTPAVPTPPVAKDPDRPVQTPQQKLEELTQERQRLEREIRYVQTRAKDAKSVLASKLAAQTPTFRSIDAGSSTPKFTPPPPVAPQRTARVGTAEEMSGHGTNTMLLVNGRPIEQSAFDAVVQYLGEAPGTATEEMRSQRALFELIRTEAVATSFEEHEGEDKLGEAMTMLDSGKTIADLVKTYGTVHGCGPDGHFEVTRNSVFGSIFEQVAFHTKPGNRARPFRNAAGFVLLQVDSFEKGASPELDKVIGAAAQVAYSTDMEAVQKAQLAVSTGQVDILVRDDKVMNLLPPMFRRPQPATPSAAPADTTGAPVKAVDLRAELMKEISGLQAEMNALAGKDDDASKAKLQELQKKYAEVKNHLRSIYDQPADTAPTPGGVKKDNTPPKKQG